MKYFITGGAGFIGSHLAFRLLQEGHEVTVYDNLLLGKKEFLKPCLEFKKFRFIKEDILDLEILIESIAGHDFVYHLAANSDISQGVVKSDIDLKLGTLATFNVLEAMRRQDVKKIAFASTSAVYGEATIKPTPETYGPLIPISFYGANKLAAEALCSAFAHNCDMQTWIFRFANIVGPHATHGAIFDFVNKLKKTSTTLKVLGDGSQKKSYLHVSDCVDGLLFAPRASGGFQILNLASQGVTTVKTMAELVVRGMGNHATIEYGSGDRGWVGDVPFTWLEGQKISELGWAPKHSSDAAVERAVIEIVRELT